MMMTIATTMRQWLQIPGRGEDGFHYWFDTRAISPGGPRKRWQGEGLDKLRPTYGFSEEKSGALVARIFCSRRLDRGARGVRAGEERSEGCRGREVAAAAEAAVDDDEAEDVGSVVLCRRFRWRASASR